MQGSSFFGIGQPASSLVQGDARKAVETIDAVEMRIVCVEEKPTDQR